MPTVYQADAFWQDYKLNNWSQINPTWDASWTATYEISATEGSTPIYTGSLNRSATEGLFLLRINTNSASTSPVLNWSAMTVGTYKLFVQFNHATTYYREERHETLYVKTQGIS